jgi:tetratricopeptide (TPR) repeat protein
VRPLDPADAARLQAAEGWLQLGNYLEANEELDRIAPRFRARPDVLEVRYNVFAAGGKWDGCLAIAETLTEQVPKRLFGWLALASARHHMGDTAGGYITLADASKRFEDAGLYYDLAHYACLLGEFEKAQMWLGNALHVGGNEWKLKALDDPRFERFWIRDA